MFVSVEKEHNGDLIPDTLSVGIDTQALPPSIVAGQQAAPDGEKYDTPEWIIDRGKTAGSTRWGKVKRGYAWETLPLTDLSGAAIERLHEIRRKSYRRSLHYAPVCPR